MGWNQCVRFTSFKLYRERFREEFFRLQFEADRDGSAIIRALWKSREQVHEGAGLQCGKKVFKLNCVCNIVDL